ncbi:hypothetical protein VMCG_00483 [Cytospora schulzeri]|uniref:G domain-containing protein n=1 Tax=Cytospora schulzeri TaxID=448051 RepID=A0A423XAA8_9PEZI|nr:hypothetical protein VMCG_00483 [Valsa malicola]
MASEESKHRESPQMGDSRSTSAPVDNAQSLKSTDTLTSNMDSANDTISAAQTGSAGTARYASQDVSSKSHEHLSDIVRINDRTPEAAGENAAQVFTYTKVKDEQQLDKASIPHDIPSTSTTVPEVDTSASMQTQETNVKMEGNDSDLLSAINLPQEPKNIALDKLRKVADSTDLAKLEAGVEMARGILDDLRIPMADSKQPKQVDWLAAIDRLKTNSTRTRTVVAVAGSTGAGKSSLINAVLDEDKLLVTSGYRACTAVITEISYNEVDDEAKAYRAEVEFISQDDWESELKLLLEDLVEDKHLSAAYIDANAEAGIAYAKIRAVYPDLTHDMIVKSKAEQLANRESVSGTLGKTREIACSNAQDLYSKLRVYLDSKDKATKAGPKASPDMAFWPLIKVVRVYCKADALSTGLVLVDLPGIHDANAARSAIASKYMSECSAIWVTSPMKRAVDDKSAKDLLGKGSRLQLKLDGIYSNVTFICTMTDAIQLSESVEAFDQDGQIQAMLSKEDELDKSIMEHTSAINRLEHLVNDKNSEYEAIEKELKIWKGLEEKKHKGQKVYPPRVPAKRKHAVAGARSRRRQHVVEDDPDDNTAEQKPLTVEEIASKLTELEAKVESMDQECTESERQWEEHKLLLVNLQNERKEIDGESTRCCIQRRNEHVREVIRVDFAAGIMEIDEEDAQDDEETFDPSIKKRDYDEVSRSLPVYCISSKAFQQLRGRTKRDTQVQGFKHLIDTEIPLLQEHAKNLPEKGRILAHKTFLNEFCLLLNSLTLWVTSSALQLKDSDMSKQDQSYEVKHLHAAVENLKKDLSMMILAQKQELCNIRQNILNSKSNAALAHASKEAVKIVTDWGTKKADGGHGIPFNTYRAICRRQGSKTKSEKSLNFNEEILQPYLLKISTSWEHAFCQLIPASLDEFVANFMKTLKNFHENIHSRPELQKCKTASLNILESQYQNHEANIKAMVGTMKASIQAEQRQASRAFLPEIKKEMVKAYSQCAEEKGRGCFQRIKEIMTMHVDKNKRIIYRKASQRVTRDLDKLFESNRKEMEEGAHSIVDDLEADYRQVISNSEMIEASVVARDHIRGVLYEVDSQFEKVLCMDQMDFDHAQSSRTMPQTASAISVTPDAPQADSPESMFIDS